jgi:hypothetical protein
MTEDCTFDIYSQSPLLCFSSQAVLMGLLLNGRPVDLL